MLGICAVPVMTTLRAPAMWCVMKSAVASVLGVSRSPVMTSVRARISPNRFAAGGSSGCSLPRSFGRLESNQVHLSNQFAHLRIDLIPAAVRTVNPDLQLQLIDLVEIACRLGDLELFYLLRQFTSECESTERGGNDDKRTCHLRMFQSKVDDRPRALWSSLPDTLPRSPGILARRGDPGDGKTSCYHNRVPEAASIVTQHAVLPCEDIELGVPHPPIGDPCVHEHDRVTLSGKLIVEPSARTSAYPHSLISRFLHTGTRRPPKATQHRDYST